MPTPADKIAKRLTSEEQERRLKALGARAARAQREFMLRFAPPADRIAVRA